MELVRQCLFSRILRRYSANVISSGGMAKRGASMGAVPCWSSSHRNFS